MAHHYTTRDFFRRAPNLMLACYFGRKELLRDVDFHAMKEGNPQSLFDAWLKLPDDQRQEMDADFQTIFTLSDEKGFRAIIDEAEWHLGDGLEDFVTELSPRYFFLNLYDGFSLGQLLAQFGILFF